MPVGHGRRRHPGKVFTRPTHGGYKDKLFGGLSVPSEGAGALQGLERLGAPMAEARSGEQTQAGDVGPQIIQTGHFDYEAAAPQVNNSPADPAAATVYVDPTGLHILDGAIFLFDYAGYSVLSSAGFAGSWVEFIQRGVYNSNFQGGALGGPWTTVTETAYPTDLEADYIASLSTDVPFYVIRTVDTGLQYSVVDDATYYRCLKVEATGAVTSAVFKFFQDVPVVPGRAYQILMRNVLTVMPVTYTILAKVDSYWKESDHSPISGPFSDSTTWSSTGPSNGMEKFRVLTGTAPENAAFIRVNWFVQFTTDGAAEFLVKGVGLESVPELLEYRIPHPDQVLGVELSPATLTYAGVGGPLALDTQDMGFLVDIGSHPSGLALFDIQTAGSSLLSLSELGNLDIKRAADSGFRLRIDQDGVLYWDYSGGGTSDYSLGPTDANTLTLTDANLYVSRSGASQLILEAFHQGDSAVAFSIDVYGKMLWGDGSTGGDLWQRRTTDAVNSGKLLEVDGSAGSMQVRGINALARPFDGNMVPNSDFEVDGNTGDQEPLTGWGTLPSGAQVVTIRKSGSYGLQITADGSSDVTVKSDLIPVREIGQYYSEVWTRGHASNSANAAGGLKVNWYDASQVYISTTTLGFRTAGTSTTWDRSVAGALTPGTDAVFCRIILYAKGTSTAGDLLFFDLAGMWDTQNYIPSGVILLWSGTSSDVPAGWAVCDGTNGTPNLVDRFIVGDDGTGTGSGGTLSPTSAITAHGTHSSAGGHTHNSHSASSATSSTVSGTTSGAVNVSGTGHSHAITVSPTTHSSQGSHTHDAHSAHEVYKHYKLAYIMKL